MKNILLLASGVAMCGAVYLFIVADKLRSYSLSDPKVAQRPFGGARPYNSMRKN